MKFNFAMFPQAGKQFQPRLKLGPRQSHLRSSSEGNNLCLIFVCKTNDFMYFSASSNLNIQQVHEGAGGSNQETQSEDEPHVLKHQVTKPSKIQFLPSYHLL